MPLADIADWVWNDDGSPGARVARAALLPLSAVFGAIVARRNRWFDRHAPLPSPIPAISIGNLTVGGTGKTPVSAWFAARFSLAGATPAVVLRGYGDDEAQVHRTLNPGVHVVAGADRVAAVRAAANAGADIAILDDAFQHRRAARVADVVLVSADRWTGRDTLLPAGPFRERLASLQRATLVVVTVKAAAPTAVVSVVDALRQVTSAPITVVDIQPGALVFAGGVAAVEPPSWVGTKVLSVSGIGDPRSFEAQLEEMGLLRRSVVLADHHRYDDATVRRLISDSVGRDAVVCTLKDAVKLAPLWPSSAVPLWYLSQSVVPRDGATALDAVVRTVLEARRFGSPL